MSTKELYARQTLVPNLQTLPSSIVVGLGGTGANMAWLLAVAGCPKLTLFDYDCLEESNLCRIPLPRAYLGLPKPEALAKWIETLRPDITLIQEGIADAWSLSLADGEFLFDCTDRWHVQDELAKWCKAKNLKYIRVGYNGGTHITMTSHHSTWLTGEPPTGYETVPSWIGAALMPSLLALIKVMLCPDLDVSLDLTELPQLLGQSQSNKKEESNDS